MSGNGSVGTQLRTWATRTVSWGPARIQIKKRAHTYARARGAMLERGGRLPEIANIYAASSPKAGSQWMRALLDHPIVREHTGLFAIPQLDYRENPERGLPLGTFVPGLYVSYETYKRIPHRHQHRCVYMFRDPRDLVVSGYYSAVSSHQNTYVPAVEKQREEIRAMSQSDGLLYLIEVSADRLRDMATWVDVVDPNVAIFRLEEVSANARENVVRMLTHCGVDLSPAELESVLNDVSRDSLQKKDLANREAGAESHYRVNRTTYRDLFGPEHHAAIEKLMPGVIEKLGYPA